MSFCGNILNLLNLHTAILNLDALSVVTLFNQWAFMMFMQTPIVDEERTKNIRQTKFFVTVKQSKLMRNAGFSERTLFKFFIIWAPAN